MEAVCCNAAKDAQGVPDADGDQLQRSHSSVRKGSTVAAVSSNVTEDAQGVPDADGDQLPDRQLS
eukprot:12400053-Karenia_brevis.AAC.1